MSRVDKGDLDEKAPRENIWSVPPGMQYVYLGVFSLQLAACMVILVRAFEGEWFNGQDGVEYTLGRGVTLWGSLSMVVLGIAATSVISVEVLALARDYIGVPVWDRLGEPVWRQFKRYVRYIIKGVNIMVLADGLKRWRARRAKEKREKELAERLQELTKPRPPLPIDDRTPPSPSYSDTPVVD